MSQERSAEWLRGAVESHINTCNLITSITSATASHPARQGLMAAGKELHNQLDRYRALLAEAADGRAAGLYRALCDTVTASGGIAREGLSDEFLILGVPAEMAARKKAQEAAERERDEAQAHARHWREAAVTENERAMEYLNAVAEAQAHAADLRGALEEIVAMNRQNALDKYGNSDKAEQWSCVLVARAALAIERRKDRIA